MCLVFVYMLNTLKNSFCMFVVLFAFVTCLVLYNIYVFVLYTYTPIYIPLVYIYIYIYLFSMF